MLYSDFTSKLLGLEEIYPENIEQKENKIEITFSMTRKKQLCPCCKSESATVHDYRKQAVRDLPMQGKNVVLLLRKRRYRYLHCAKRFYEEIPFLSRYHRMTNRLAAFVIHQLAGVHMSIVISAVLEIVFFICFCIKAFPTKEKATA